MPILSCYCFSYILWVWLANDVTENTSVVIIAHVVLYFLSNNLASFRIFFMVLINFTVFLSVLEFVTVMDFHIFWSGDKCHEDETRVWRSKLSSCYRNHILQLMGRCNCRWTFWTRRIHRLVVTTSALTWNNNIWFL